VKQQQESKRRRWRHHHDRIEAAKSHPVDTILKPLPNCCELLLDGLSNGKSEPSSQSAADENTDMCDAAAAGDKTVDGNELEDADDILNIELDVV